MLKGLHHTGFVVRDLEKSVSFYTETMGLEVTMQLEVDGEFAERIVGFKDAHLKVAMLNMGDGHNLELVQYFYPPSAEGQINRNDLGASHLAFLVENIEEYYTTMSQKGLRFLGAPPTLTLDGKVVLTAIYAQDPDNNWLEFLEFPG